MFNALMTNVVSRAVLFLGSLSVVLFPTWSITTPVSNYSGHLSGNQAPLSASEMMQINRDYHRMVTRNADFFASSYGILWHPVRFGSSMHFSYGPKLVISKRENEMRDDVDRYLKLPELISIRIDIMSLLLRELFVVAAFILIGKLRVPKNPSFE